MLDVHQAPQRMRAVVVYRGGLTEQIDLVRVPQGWRVCSIPLGSDVIAFGDWVTLSTSSTTPAIVGIRAGGWLTIRSRTRIPPLDSIIKEIEQRQWRAAWSADGQISLAVREDDRVAAHRAVQRWERAGAFQGMNGPGVSLTA